MIFKTVTSCNCFKYHYVRGLLHNGRWSLVLIMPLLNVVFVVRFVFVLIWICGNSLAWQNAFVVGWFLVFSVDVYFRCRTGAWWCSLHGPQQQAEVCSICVIKMYGSMSLMCIFDNCRLAITSEFRWMDGRMERDGLRRIDGEGWMDESRDG